MKYFYSVLLLLTALHLNAQTVVSDSVSMGPGYQYDIFYNLNNGSKTAALINEWDLAFCINPMDVGIRINSINGVSLWTIPATDTSGWATVDSAGYQSWPELHNTDSAMFAGAFNVSGTASQFDFSWGVYDFNTHEVIGDSLFLMKVTDPQGNEYFKKLWIIKRADNSTHDWVFRYANIDNTGDVTVTIPSTSYATKNFVYYSIINGNTVDREPGNPDWDMEFTRYTTDVGGGTYYPVAGVYSNYGVLVADVRPVDVASVTSDAPYLSLYTDKMDEIGYDWKTFNLGTNSWDVEDSLLYFVRTNAGEVYKVVMTGFDGSVTGNIFFDKTLISTTGISETADASSLHLYPNPAGDIAHILYTCSRQEKITIGIYDMNGKVAGNYNTDSAEGFHDFPVSVSHLNSGVYLVVISNGSQIHRQKLIVP